MPYPDIDPVLIHLGPFPIRWYALAYIAGIVLGWMYLTRLLRADHLWAGAHSRQAGPPIGKEGLDDLLLWVTIGVILGGRIGFVLFYRPELLAVPPGEWARLFGLVPIPPALEIWSGGMSFHGGMLGVTLALFGFARSRGIRTLAIADLLATATPIGLFFGRLANFINAELYGRPWDGPWAIVFPRYYDQDAGAWVYAADAVPRHPSQLYEAALEGLLLFIIIRIAITRLGALRFPGAATGLFLAGYGAARFFVEFFREPDTYQYAGPLGFLTRGMMLSLPMIVVGAALFLWAWRRRATRLAGIS